MKPLSWGLIGCGDIARKRVAPALRDLDSCELVAVARRRPELADSFAREFGARKHFQSWRELLTDREVDAVYLATPVYLHAEQAVAAAEAGKHVLCEKPMAMNVAECDRIIAAARAHQVKLGVAYYRYFYRIVIRARELIQSGEIGSPVIAQVNAFEYFNPDADDPRAWLLKRAQSGGGPMFDFGCHRIEVLTHLLGPITKVKAQTANVIFDREVEDTAVAAFRFAGGAAAVLTVTHAAAEAQDTLDIFGTSGSIHIPKLNGGELRVIANGDERREDLPLETNLHAPLISDFVDAVINDRDPAVPGETGRMVASIEEEIFSAASSQRR